MSKDAELLDTAPILAQAARAQVAAMMSRLAARGFDQTGHGPDARASKAA